MTRSRGINQAVTKLTIYATLLYLVSIITISGCLVSCVKTEDLPIDRSQRIIITNDAGTHDVFQAEFALALASRGDITLVGIVAEKVWRGDKYDDFINDAYPDLIEMARRSGMVNLPEVKSGFLPGATWTLEMPNSKKVIDTMPIISEGAIFIEEEVLKSNPDKPLIICTGGGVTAVASSYLLAVQQGKGQDFIDRVIVVSNLANAENNQPLKGFNFYVDPWAGYIVLKNLRNVLANLNEMEGCGIIDRNELFKTMPQTELKRFILDKDLTNEWLPGNIIGDAAPLLLVLYPKKGMYYKATKRMALTDEWREVFSESWFPTGLTDSPIIVDERDGNINVVSGCVSKTGSDYFASVMSDPNTYKGAVVQQAPFKGKPVDLNGRIEMEAFDFGQEGYAYHDEAFSSIRSQSASKLRMLERPDLERTDDPSGGEFHLAYLSSGEWLEYTVEAMSSGYYSATARVSSDNKSGCFHLEFRDPDSDEIKAITSKVIVPNTGGFDKWSNSNIPKFFLQKGIYVMRFVNCNNMQRIEVEDLQYKSSCEVETVIYHRASEGRGHILKCAAGKGYIEYYNINVLEGKYKIIVGNITGIDHGIACLKINGSKQKNAADRPFIIDQYSSKQGELVFEYGDKVFSTAEKILMRFESIGKNQLSKGLNLGFDYIEIQSEGPYKINYIDFANEKSSSF